MVATAELVSRARVCAGCHVGEPAHDGLPPRDVDHDLIAAGHPRLNFEFSAYLATMARHWRDDTGPDATADFPARAWAVGQLVSAQAALDLLRDRARRSRPGDDRERPTSWPEFSEYGCFSCHHDLRDDPWRRGHSAAPGSPRWGTWHFAVLEALASSAPSALRADGLKELRQLMGEPQPDPAEVDRQASVVSGELGRWLAAVSNRRYDVSLVESLLLSVSPLSERGGVTSWDQATQRYLALVPLNQALRSLAPGRVDPRRTEELNRLRDFLRYPRGYDSPKSFNPAAVPAVR